MARAADAPAVAIDAIMKSRRSRRSSGLFDMTEVLTRVDLPSLQFCRIVRQWPGGTHIDRRWTWAQLGGSVRAQRSSEQRKGQALCPHCTFHQISIFTMWSTT